MQAPKAKRIPHPHELHGDVRQDDYYWLRDKENPEVIAYLEEENRYFEEAMKPLADATERIFEKMVARIPEAESNVPAQYGPYFYYSRMTKDLQYPVYARKKAASRGELQSAEEEVVLDLNALAVDGGYLSVTDQKISPDHTRLAYLENRDGTDMYTVFVKDLTTGELLSDRIENVFIHGSIAWDASGEYLFYIVVDETQRPYQLWRHRIGTTSGDELLYEEEDFTYTLTVSKSRSGEYLFLHSENKETTEIRYLRAASPLSGFQLFDARRPGVQYDLEHWKNDFLILTNDGAKNFKLLRCPVDNTVEASRSPLFPYDESRFTQGVYPFASVLLIEGRQNGLTQLWIYRDGALSQLSFEEDLYTVSVGANGTYDTTEALIVYESLLTPRTTYALSLTSGSLETLQVAPVPGEYDKQNYVQERLWATAQDGVKVPMMVMYRKGALVDGPAPMILSGYGSYGINSDPSFTPMRLPFLDLGIVFVTAQVRGGSEMGYTWYEDGKFLNKKNTFTDFIAVAEDLIVRGYTTPDKLAARGGSAGGLLMGAVANMAPHLFQVVQPAVPFVDVVTTILDETIPLSTLEWDEWGNPSLEEYYHYIKSYSPYDNVEAKAYPHLLITSGLNDPRVPYWEPTKWTAKLRVSKTDDNMLLLKTNMGAGHFGSSGRFNQLREQASYYAFILDKIGVTV